MENIQLKTYYFSQLQKYGYQVTAYSKKDELFNNIQIIPDINVLVTDQALSKLQKLVIEDQVPSKVIKIVQIREPVNALSKIELNKYYADVCLTQPVDINALVAVVDGVFRQIPIGNEITKRQQSRSKYQLCSDKRTLRLSDGEQVDLTDCEGIVLHTLAQTAPHPVSRKCLSESLGHNFLYYDERKLEAIVSRLRRKIKPITPNFETIKAARGQGYQLLLNVVAE